MQENQEDIEIVRVKVEELNPAPYNPRKWSIKATKDLTDSIERYGLIDPIIVNSAEERKNVVIGGHFRLSIAKKLGYKEVPVIYIEIPDIEKEKELNLRLNRNNGEWDFSLLKEFDSSFLLEVGFESEEIDKIFAIEIDEDDFDAQKEYDKIKEPVAKYGDIYALGGHRLMCGSSESRDDFERLMDGKLAHLIFTDPPYNVDYHAPGGLDYDSKKYGGSGQIMNDNKSDKDCLDFYTNTLKNLYDFSMSDVTIYWWFANTNTIINQQSFKITGWKFSQIIIWLKNSMVFSRGQDYHRCYEPCMLGWKKGQRHYRNKMINNLKDVFSLDQQDFSELIDVWYQRRDNVQEYVHPTQKPVKLAERAIKKNSKMGDIVLDAFGGSGSTLIACEQMERSAYLMELDAKFVDVIIARYERFTGKKAVKL